MLSEPFGFTHEPFRVTPDTRFFFPGSNHEDIALQLLAPRREPTSISLLTGPAGSGKTLLLRWLLAKVGQDIPSALVWGAHLSFDEILSTLCVRFEVSSGKAGRTQNLRDLEATVSGYDLQGRHAWLLLDEADGLSNEVLNNLTLLADLNLKGRPLFTIVLAAGEGFSKRLKQSSLGRRPLHEYRLLPLGREQTHAYVDHRLEVAGYKDGDLFTTEAIERLFMASGGIPGVINGICGRALFLAFMKDTPQVTAEVIDEVIQDMGIIPHEVEPAPEVTAPLNEVLEAKPETELAPEKPNKHVQQAVFEEDNQKLPAILEMPVQHQRLEQRVRRVDYRKVANRQYGRVAILAGIGALLVGAFVVAITPPPLPETTVRPDALVSDTLSHHREITPVPLSETAIQLYAGTELELKKSGVSKEKTSSPATGSKVVRAQFTTGIREREPINQLGPVIQAAKAGQLYYFTELRNMRGETITHRWEYEGRVVTEVPFRIKSDSWRVYSRKQLTPATKGNWLVVVTDSKGEVIRRDSFKYGFN
jgi:type II secretory pathway predicted ATPase ExeA